MNCMEAITHGNPVQDIKNDWSISATVAGFLAVLISYSGPLIIFSKRSACPCIHRYDGVMDLGISIGAAVSGIYLSIKYKTPVITAWSAPVLPC